MAESHEDHHADLEALRRSVPPYAGAEDQPTRVTRRSLSNRYEAALRGHMYQHHERPPQGVSMGLMSKDLLEALHSRMHDA